MSDKEMATRWNHEFFSRVSLLRIPAIHLVPKKTWEPSDLLSCQKYTTKYISAAFAGYLIKIRLLFRCVKITATKFRLCLLLIILGTIALQGARPWKPHFFRRQPGCTCLLLGLYILRTYAFIVAAQPYCALNSCRNVRAYARVVRKKYEQG